jgi:hypothetical protein
MPVQPDVNTADWSAAHRRRTGSSEEIAPVRDVSTQWEITPLGETGPAFGAPVVLGIEPQPLLTTPVAVAKPPRRQTRWIYLMRLWALVKMGSLAYTTWWAMGSVHASPGATASAYGAVCLFAGFGARWRKRFFGPGQIVEPELYEEVGRWMYRLGVVLVLIGGTVVIAQSALKSR